MRSLFLTALFVLAAISRPLFALDLKSEIELAQARFGNVMANYPIVIIDQDEMDWRYIQNGVGHKRGKEFEKIRSSLLKHYIAEKVQVELTEMQASQLEPYTSVMKDGAFALPIVENYRTAKYKICAVFTSSANSNQRLEHERLLGLNQPNIFTTENYDQLKWRIDYNSMALFSLYHEISHCLDSRFMPSIYSRGEDAHTMHEAESFAESLASLLLVDRDWTKHLKARGFHRTIYSRMVGKFMAQNSHLGFGHPFFKAGGVIYNLEPALRGVQDFITLNRNRLKEMSLAEKIAVTEEIVTKHALSSRGFNVIVNYLESTKPEEAIQLTLQRAIDWPEFFYEPYKSLISYVTYSEALVSQSFDQSISTSGINQSESLMEIPLNRLCDALTASSKEDYLEILLELRSDLRTTQSSADLQRNRAQELNELSQSLLQKCPLH